MDEQVNSAPTMADYYSMIKMEHEANNAWSAEQAQKAMDYQTQMSNTAHQREVADLKAAGLNPILSAGGQGATTGSGMAAQRSDSNVEALYGLTKMAIESNMEQAKAMQNTAKYASGSAGNSNPVSVVSNPFVNKEDKKKGIANKKDQTLEQVANNAGLGDVYEFIDGLENALADRWFRRYGVKQETSKKVMKTMENELLASGKTANERAYALALGALGYNTAKNVASKSTAKGLDKFKRVIQ